MKKLLLTVGIIALATPAFASLTTDEAVSIPYLRNYGYSDATNEILQMERAKFNGKVYVADRSFPYCREYNREEGFKKGVKWFFNYISPDREHCTFYNHDIKFYGSASDY